MADTGRIRCPINFPFSSNTAILREASVGRTTWREREIEEGSCKSYQKDRGERVRERWYVCSSYLIEDKHFIIPHRVQRVPIGRFGSILPFCISRKPKYVHFHVHTHLLISQELAWDHLVDIKVYMFIIDTKDLDVQTKKTYNMFAYRGHINHRVEHNKPTLSIP